MKKHILADDEAMAAVDLGIEHLKRARDHFKQAECPKTLERVRSALSSAKGARRNVGHRPYHRKD